MTKIIMISTPRGGGHFYNEFIKSQQNQKPMSDSTDPKETTGENKTPLQLLPPVFKEQTAKVLAHGNGKYGAWNWRLSKVNNMTYLGAIERHLDAYKEGEETDPESGESHLAHIAASVAILLDAEANETLVDNRPPVNMDGQTPSGEVDGLFDRFQPLIAKALGETAAHGNSKVLLKSIPIPDAVFAELRKNIDEKVIGAIGLTPSNVAVEPAIGELNQVKAEFFERNAGPPNPVPAKEEKPMTAIQALNLLNRRTEFVRKNRDHIHATIGRDVGSMEMFKFMQMSHDQLTTKIVNIGPCDCNDDKCFLKNFFKIS